MNNKPSKSTSIELHIIQNFAPSCLNRDDTNTPKDCVFGGVRRARISSQCIKRAIRLHEIFQNVLALNPTFRSRWPKEILESKIKKIDSSKIGLTSIIGKFLGMLSKGSGEQDDGDQSDDESSNKKRKQKSKKEYECLDNSTWLSTHDMKKIIEFVSENVELIQKTNKKEEKNKIVQSFCKQYKDCLQSPDISLFGRMLANAQKLNVDAACQVAHAISTHKVDIEMDYFTTVEDLPLDDNSGADYIGTTEFNSACFYRFAVINWELLIKNLENNLKEDAELAQKTVEAFVRASIEAIPTGKQNTFAAHNPPSLVFVTVRNGAPWSLANAFEKPIRSNDGYTQKSIQALDAYWGKLSKVYTDNAALKTWLCLDDESTPENLGETAGTVDGLIEKIREALS